jgi:hypothetical protein
MINRNRYVNLDGESTTKSLNDMRKWQKERRAKLPNMSFIVPQSSEKMMGYLRINRNADDTTKEALGRLVKEWERRELCEEELRIMKLGETFLI